MLDIGVGDALCQPPDPDEPSLGLEDDGYYWFLHPLFERLAGETGQYIDLYGDALFAGPDLLALSRMLSEARRLVGPSPSRGTSIPARKSCRSTKMSTRPSIAASS